MSTNKSIGGSNEKGEKSVNGVVSKIINPDLEQQVNAVENPILKIAYKHLCDLKRVRTIDERCITFKINYACERFWADMLEYGKKKEIGWFIKNGKLLVYR